MKNQVTAFFVTALIASMSLAQNSSTAKMSDDDGVSSKGIRISLVRPTLDMKATVKYQGYSFDGAGKPDSALGLAVGYASLPVQELGWTTNAALIETKDESSANIARVDGNLGYAFNKYVNLKGGLNVMKFTSSNGVKDLNAGFGFQASLGFQLNKNVGLDFGYSELNTSGKTPVTSNGQEIGKADIEVKMTGLEVALTATF
jgi:hypothetical protein